MSDGGPAGSRPPFIRLLPRGECREADAEYLLKHIGRLYQAAPAFRRSLQQYAPFVLIATRAGHKVQGDETIHDRGDRRMAELQALGDHARGHVFTAVDLAQHQQL